MSTKMADQAPDVIETVEKEEKKHEIKDENVQIEKETSDQKQVNKKEDECEKPSTKTSTSKVESGNVKTLYQGRSQQCLPHVLSDYGMETNRQKTKKLADKARRERRRRKRRDYLEGDDERDKEREQLKEEKYLSIVDDLHKLRNYYYREYRDLLTDKIVRQRQEIRERSEAMLNQAKEKDQEEKEARRKDRRKPKHVLIHDEQFLQKCHKTNMAKIVNLQTKLQKEGKLKTQSDIDSFWTSIHNPDVFALYFNTNNGLPTSGDNSVFSVARQPSTRPLSQINESAESSRPITRSDNWAVTQQYKHQHKNIGGMTRQKTSSSLGKQAAMNMEKRCPVVEMPPLHCFTMDLSEKPPDPEVLSKRVQLKAIEKQRKKFMGKLHKMHQLAMANHALASRILDQHEDLTMFLQGPELSDLISDYYYNKPATKELVLVSPPLNTSDKVAADVAAIKYQVLPEIASRSNSDISQRLLEIEYSEDKTLISDGTSECKMRMLMEKPSSPLPLTMNEVMAQCRIVESTGLSSNWSNYLHAGKAV